MEKEEYAWAILILIMVICFSYAFGAGYGLDWAASKYCLGHGYSEGSYRYRILNETECVNETGSETRYERFVCDGKEVLNITPIETIQTYCPSLFVGIITFK